MTGRSHRTSEPLWSCFLCCFISSILFQILLFLGEPLVERKEERNSLKPSTLDGKVFDPRCTVQFACPEPLSEEWEELNDNCCRRGGLYHCQERYVGSWIDSIVAACMRPVHCPPGTYLDLNDVIHAGKVTEEHCRVCPPPEFQPETTPSHCFIRAGCRKKTDWSSSHIDVYARTGTSVTDLDPNEGAERENNCLEEDFPTEIGSESRIVVFRAERRLQNYSLQVLTESKAVSQVAQAVPEAGLTWTRTEDVTVNVEATYNTEGKATEAESEDKATPAETAYKTAAAEAEDKATAVDDKVTASETEDKATGSETEDKATGMDDKVTASETEDKATGSETEDKATGMDDKVTASETEDKATGSETEDKATGMDDKVTGSETEDKATGSETEDKATGSETEDESTAAEAAEGEYVSSDMKARSASTNKENTVHSVLQSADIAEAKERYHAELEEQKRRHEEVRYHAELEEHLRLLQEEQKRRHEEALREEEMRFREMSLRNPHRFSSFGSSRRVLPLPRIEKKRLSQESWRLALSNNMITLPQPRPKLGQMLDLARKVQENATSAESEIEAAPGETVAKAISTRTEVKVALTKVEAKDTSLETEAKDTSAGTEAKDTSAGTETKATSAGTESKATSAGTETNATSTGTEAKDISPETEAKAVPSAAEDEQANNGGMEKQEHDKEKEPVWVFEMQSPLVWLYIHLMALVTLGAILLKLAHWWLKLRHKNIKQDVADIGKQETLVHFQLPTPQCGAVVYKELDNVLPLLARQYGHLELLADSERRHIGIAVYPDKCRHKFQILHFIRDLLSPERIKKELTSCGLQGHGVQVTVTKPYLSLETSAASRLKQLPVNSGELILRFDRDVTNDAVLKKLTTAEDGIGEVLSRFELKLTKIMKGSIVIQFELPHDTETFHDLTVGQRIRILAEELLASPSFNGLQQEQPTLKIQFIVKGQLEHITAVYAQELNLQVAHSANLYHSCAPEAQFIPEPSSNQQDNEGYVADIVHSTTLQLLTSRRAPEVQVTQIQGICNIIVTCPGYEGNEDGSVINILQDEWANVESLLRNQYPGCLLKPIGRFITWEIPVTADVNCFLGDIFSIRRVSNVSKHRFIHVAVHYPELPEGRRRFAVRTDTAGKLHVFDHKIALAMEFGQWLLLHIGHIWQWWLHLKGNIVTRISKEMSSHYLHCSVKYCVFGSLLLLMGFTAVYLQPLLIF